MMTIMAAVLLYFALLFAVSRWTARGATNDTFFRAGRKSPWYMVAFGMVGASISGITFVSVPGMVVRSQMTYLQTCMGFIVGYAVVAFVLLPLYYRLNLTSIYAYLGQRLGARAHKTGSAFFLLSKMTGAAVRFYVVCIVLQQFVFGRMGVPFGLTAVGMVALIWLYTRRGGIKTLVWTDSLQTLLLFSALFLIIYKVAAGIGITSVGQAARAVADSGMARVFVFDDWVSTQNFWKQFLSGIFIVVVMTGLDQDMMQKNLTCKTLRGAQKDMCCYGVAFLPANLLFLSLGVLLVLWYQQQGMPLPAAGDALLPDYITATARGQCPAADAQCSVPDGSCSVFNGLCSVFDGSWSVFNGQWLELLFVLGIVAASFSSADSALTSLTTIYCVDIKEQPDNEALRKRVHLLMCGVFVAFLCMFKAAGSSSLIDVIYTLVGYTYGPLLGLFAFGLLTRRQVRDAWVPCVAVASPLVCLAVETAVGRLTGYHFGYELLMLNGLLTFAGLWMLRK